MATASDPSDKTPADEAAAADSPPRDVAEAQTEPEGSPAGDAMADAAPEAGSRQSDERPEERSEEGATAEAEAQRQAEQAAGGAGKRGRKSKQGKGEQDKVEQDKGEQAKGEKRKSKARSKARAKPKPAFDPPPPDRLVGAVEALLLAAGDVVREARLRDLLGLPAVAPLTEALETIEKRWSEAGLAFELERVAKGVRVVTRPEYAEYVGRLRKRPVSDKLTKSQLETLSIVAYKQPVGRAEVERIRGVQAGEALRSLLERELLRVVGRSDQPGRPLLYGTTDTFLTLFGLRDLEDLPSHQDLERM